MNKIQRKKLFMRVDFVIDHIKSSDPDKLTIDYLQRTSKNIYLFIKNMLEPLRKQMGNVGYSDDWIDIERRVLTSTKKDELIETVRQMNKKLFHIRKKMIKANLL